MERVIYKQLYALKNTHSLSFIEKQNLLIGIVARIIKSKEIFQRNSDIEPYLKLYIPFKKNLVISPTLLSSRPDIIGRLASLIIENQDTADLYSIISINLSFIEVYRDIEKEMWMNKNNNYSEILDILLSSKKRS